MSLTLTAALAATVLAGCGGGGDKGAASAGELNIFVWTEYVPDSVIQKFTEETGIQVNVSTFSSNEDMLSKVKAESEGTYDIVQPSDYMVEQMIAQDMLQELDLSKLENFKNIGDAYKNPSYDPDNKHSVPYLGGAAVIAVNTGKVDLDITSYDDLFDPALANSLVALDDYRAVIGMTARSMGKSMNETDPAVLSEVEAKLLTLKPNMKLYDSDSPKSALISGDCTAGFVWSAEAALAMEEDPDIKTIYPEEGPYLFLDSWCVTKGAKNTDAAMKFIDYMLEVSTMQEVLAEFPYMCPNTAAVEAMGEEYASNPAKNPPADAIAAGEYVKNLDTETLAIYDSMWTKLKG